MQSACPRCQVRYAFDADAIPQAGYEARCHRCGATFYVVPPATPGAPPLHQGPPAPKDEEAVGLSRAMAETLAAEDGRFARPPHEDAPAPARRPSLASLFDGDLHDAAAPAGGRNDDGSRGRDLAATPTDTGDDRVDAAPIFAVPAPAVPSAGQAAPRGRPSRPWADVTQRVAADDVAPTRSRARLGLVLGMVCVAIVTLGVVVGVVRSEQLHLPTQVPPPLHIVRDPPPEAVAAFDRGMAALRRDNPDDLDRAAETFADARAIDRDYTDAWAGEALARLLRAEAARQQAVAAEAELARTGAELAALADAQGARAQLLVPAGADDAEADDGEGGSEPEPAAHRALEVASAALRLRTLARGQAALQARLAEAAATARRNEVQAASLLLHAEQLLGQTPLLATVVASWLAGDPMQQALAPEQLKVAEQLGAQAVVQPRRSWGEAPSPATATAPYAAWRMLARAQLARKDQTVQGGPAEAVVATYEAALRLDDGLRRARYLYAAYLAEHGRPAEAELHLRQLLQGEPRHQQAAALLGRLQARVD